MAGLYHGAGGAHGETWGWIEVAISPHPFRVERGDYRHTPPGVETPGCLPGPLRGPASDWNITDYKAIEEILTFARRFFLAGRHSAK